MPTKSSGASWTRKKTPARQGPAFELDPEISEGHRYSLQRPLPGFDNGIWLCKMLTLGEI